VQYDGGDSAEAIAAFADSVLGYLVKQDPRDSGEQDTVQHMIDSFDKLTAMYFDADQTRKTPSRTPSRRPTTPAARWPISPRPWSRNSGVNRARCKATSTSRKHLTGPLLARLGSAAAIGF
jgi:hypothetical protein